MTAFAAPPPGGAADRSPARDAGRGVPGADPARAGRALGRADPRHARDQPDQVGPAHRAEVRSGSTTTPRSLTDDRFLKALRNTFFYTIVSVPVGLTIALGLAIALNTKVRGIAFIRTAYFLPVVTSTIAIALVWQWIYSADSGLLNQVLGHLRDPGPEVAERPDAGDAVDHRDVDLAGPRRQRDHLPGRAPGDPVRTARRGQRRRRRELGPLPAT